MNDLTKRMSALSSAEEFLDFFEVPYEQPVVHVNRLHILKRFHQYLRTTSGTSEMDETTLRQTCKELLGRAYADFVRSTPAKEKVFKVFQDQDGRSVSLDKLRMTMPSQQ